MSTNNLKNTTSLSSQGGSAPWAPRFSLDLLSASNKAFNKLLEDFEVWRQSQAERPLDLSDGWKEITQEISESMLLRNPVGANRRPTLPTVKYYARQMKAKAWKKTGEPLLFDTNGKLIDAGHRLWASYLSGASFPSYLVGSVPPDPTIFAYVDSGKNRSASDALATAGLNGLAKRLNSVVNMAMHYDHGCYTASTKRALDKVTPIEVVQYVQEHDDIRTAVRLMAGEYSSAAKVILHKEVAAFLAFLIITNHDEETLDEFMTPLGQLDIEHEDGSPIAAFQKVMEEDEHAKEPMKKHQVLGHAIKTFNSFILGEKVKRITLRVNEAYPRIVPPQPTQQAAE